MVAIVTGGTRGIGKAIASRLYDNGMDIAVTYVQNKESADAMVEEITNKHGSGKIKAYQVDGRNLSDCKQFIKQVKQDFDEIDLIVNNSGINRDAMLIMMQESQFDDVIDTNLKSLFNMCKYIVPVFMKQRRGNIINISSVAGLDGNIGQINYAASKAGVIGFTKSLAKEYASYGIICNAIAPGFIETDMTEQMEEKEKKRIMENIPLKRSGKPEEIAALVCFLASKEASYITGQVIRIDGGLIL